MLDLIIWELTQIKPELGSSITGQMMGHSPRFRALLALARTRGLKSALVTEIKKLSERMFEAAERRNRLVHDAWYVSDETKNVAQFRSSSHKSDRHGFRRIEEKEITQTIGIIRDRIGDVSSLRGKIHRELPSLR